MTAATPLAIPEGAGVRRQQPASRPPMGGWCLATIIFLLLAGVFPLWLTKAELSTLLRPQSALATVVILWSSLRLAQLIQNGEAAIVQATFWVFVYVWFGLAGLAETATGSFPIAGQVFSDGVQVRALLAIILGLIAYEIGRSIHRSVRLSRLSRWSEDRQVQWQRFWVVVFLGAAGTLFALWRYGLSVLFSSRFTAAEAQFGTPPPGVRLDQIGNKAVGILQATFTWAPAFLALYLLFALMNGPTQSDGERRGLRASPVRLRLLLIGLLGANLLVNNPITSPRYRFGGAALALLVVAWPLKNPPRFRVWICALLAGVLFLLPLLDIFRYDQRSIKLTPLKEQLVASPDFGMFQQEVNAQVYVDAQGFTFGRQVLGVLAVYVPRAFWNGKPTDTGNLIVRSNAINASASLWATVFVDGGFPAVCLVFVLYGWMTALCEDVYLRRWRESSFVAAGVPLYAGFQIILLRGDLQPAVGQLAPLLAMLLYVSWRGAGGAARREV